MRIKYLSTNKKRLNAILIIAILLSFVPLIIISLLLFLGQANNYLSTGLLILSLTAMFLAVILSLLQLIIRPKLALVNDSLYELEINTDKNPSTITKAKEIQYSCNFLKHAGLNQNIEIDNQVTFNLLKSGIIQSHKIHVKKRKTNMLHESPKALLSDFLVSMESMN